MSELKVTFYLKKNEEKTDGTMLILGRIRIGKSMVQFSTKVYAILSLWDVKSAKTCWRKRKTYQHWKSRTLFKAYLPSKKC